MADITIRRATPADEQIVAANNAAMAFETENKELDRETITSGVRRVLSDPARGVYYLAECDGKVVGQLLITLEWTDWRDGWFWWIQSVYVAPGARRRGVYRALHEHVETAARQEEDVRGIRLYADNDNTSAQRVYEQMGMVRAHYTMFETDWSNPK